MAEPAAEPGRGYDGHAAALARARLDAIQKADRVCFGAQGDVAREAIRPQAEAPRELHEILDAGVRTPARRLLAPPTRQTGMPAARAARRPLAGILDHERLFGEHVELLAGLRGTASGAGLPRAVSSAATTASKYGARSKRSEITRTDSREAPVTSATRRPAARSCPSSSRRAGAQTRLRAQRPASLLLLLAHDRVEPLARETPGSAKTSRVGRPAISG